MDEPTLRRLYIAHELLLEALTSSRDPAPVPRMRTLLLVDQAAELMVRSALAALRSPGKPRDPFPVLLGNLMSLAAAAALKPHQPAVARTHELRNQVQHAGMIPSREEAEFAAVHGNIFCRAVTDTVFGTTPDQLTPVALLTDAAAREGFFMARAALIEGRVADGCKEIAVTFYRAIADVLENLDLRHGSDIRTETTRRLFTEIGRAATKAAIYVDGPSRASFDEFSEQFARQLDLAPFLATDEAFDPLVRLVILSSAGIAPFELLRFEEAVPHVVFSTNRTAQLTTSRVRPWPPSAEAAQAAFDFAVRALLKLESWARR